MIMAKMLVALGIVSTIGAVSAPSFHPSMPRQETTTRPWTAPVGRRQPHASDIPLPGLGTQYFPDQEDAIIDRKISGICRGC